MDVYESPFPTCDKILHLFTIEKPSINRYNILILLGYSNTNQGDTLPAIEKLLKDGHLVEFGNNLFKLGGDAVSFRNKGGYEGLFERNNLKEQIENERAKDNILTSKSIRKTNKVSRKTNKVLKSTAKIQIGIAIITLFVVSASVYISWLNYKSTQLNERLELRLKSLETSVQQLKVQLQQKPPTAKKLSPSQIKK